MSLVELSSGVEPESLGVAEPPAPGVAHSGSFLCSASSQLPGRSTFDPSVSLGNRVGDGLGLPSDLEGTRTDSGVAASDLAETKYAAIDSRIGRTRAARTPSAMRRVVMTAG
jgi:hypothetical protein